MPDQKPEVTIIILNYNGGEDVLACLESVMQIVHPRCEVFVVDNGSTDGSPDRIADRFPWVKIITTGSNLGFPAGNNIGIKQSSGEWILLLNDDVVVDREILKDLIAAAEADPQVGIAGPAILYYKEPEKLWSAGGRINLCGFTEHIDKGMGLEACRSPHYVDYITGCAMLIKRAVLAKIGLLDEDYFLYFEDADYCARARRAGFKCLYVPSPTVWHKADAEWITGPMQAYYYMRNGFIFARKNLKGLRRFLFITGQFILFPYYFLKLAGRNRKALRHLARGFRDGLCYQIDKKETGENVAVQRAD